MSIEGVVTSFVGQLFHGEAKSKSWTPLIAGQVAVQLRQKEGGAWWIVASKKEEMWQKCLDSNFKYRIKDSFIQWQYHGDSGEMETFGLRVKNGDIAKQFEKAVDMILRSSPAMGKQGSPKRSSRVMPPAQAPPTSKNGSPPPAKRSSRATPPSQAPPTSRKSSLSDPPAKRPSRAAPPIQAPPPPTNAEKLNEVEDCVVLKVQILGKEETTLKVPRSVPLERILKSVCGRKQLDHALYAVAQPVSAHGQPSLCHAPNMTVGDLKTNEIHLVRKDSQPSQQGPAEEEGSGEQLSLLQVELPKSEHTVVRVAPSILMGELLCYICGKRNINPAHHRFDLPVTEESLAQRSLQQLKITSIRIIAKASAPAGDATPPKVDTPPSPQKSKHKGKKKSSDSDPGDSRGSPLHRGVRKGMAAPPPPVQRRKTQPDFVQELEKELTGRKNKGEGEVGGVTEGTAMSRISKVNEEGAESKNMPPALRTDGRSIEDAQVMTSEQPALLTEEVGGAKPTDSPRKSKGSLLRPRTKPAPMPPSALSGEAVKVKGHPPPPVSSKPQARGSAKQGNIGLDEPDFATPTNGECGDEEEGPSTAQARQDIAGMEGSITSALKEQAENRFLTVKPQKKEHILGEVGEGGEQDMTRHGSLEKDKVRTPRSKPPDSGDMKTGRHGLGEQRVKDFSSLRKKPKGPAPLPPPLARAHTLTRLQHIDIKDVAATTKSLSVDQGESGDPSAVSRRKTETSSSLVSGGGTSRPTARSVSEVVPPSDGTIRRPLRKAPLRPPPSAPSKTDSSIMGRKAVPVEFEKTQPILEGDDHKEAETTLPILSTETTETPSKLPQRLSPSTLPLAARRSSPKNERALNEVSPRSSAMAICRDTEDGGKVLIVKPSPGSTHRSLGATPIVFKLPPPPPQPPTEQPAELPPEVPSSEPPEVPSPSSEFPPPLSVAESTKEVTAPTSPVEVGGKKKRGKGKKSKPITSEKPRKRKTRSKTPPTEDKPHPETTPTEYEPHPETPPTKDRPHPETPPKVKEKPGRPQSKPHTQPELEERPATLPVGGSRMTTPPASEVTPPIPAALEAAPSTPSAVSEVSSLRSNFSPVISPGGGLLNATIVSNEFTNLDDLLSNSSLQDIVTTDFSIEENLEPPRDSAGTGTRLDSAGLSIDSRSDSESSVMSDEGGFHIPSGDEDHDGGPTRGSPRYRFQRTTPTKPSSNHSSPSRSPGHRRPVPSPPNIQGMGVTNPMMLLLNSNANNNNNNNTNVAGNIVAGKTETHNITHRLSTTSTTGESGNSGNEGVWCPSGPHGNRATHRNTHVAPFSGYMSGEPMSGSESDTAESAPSLEDAFGGDGEIVLLSVKPHLKEDVLLSEGSATIADVESGHGHVEEGWIGEREGSKVQMEMEEEGGGYRMGDVTLDELDGVVSDLRELVEHSTPPQDSAHLAFAPPPPPVSDLPPSPPPSPPPLSSFPPSPPLSSFPPSPPSSPASSIHTTPSPSPSPSSSLPPSPPPPAPALPTSFTEGRNMSTPPPPPPPSSLPPPEDTTNSSQLNKKIRSRFSAKPEPPITKPVVSSKPKGLFKRKHSLTRSADVDDSADSARDELFEKMRERQEKLKAQAKDPSPRHKRRTLEDSDQQRSRSSSGSSQQLKSGSGSNLDQQQTSGSGSNPGGDNVQMQLQFLQQQVIQQQMVQLQQQFQQLLTMNPGISLPGMGMGIPNMGVTGMNVPGMGMNMNTATPGMGMNPNMNMPGMGFVQGQVPGMATSMQMGMSAQHPQASALGGIPQGQPMMSSQMMPMQQQQMMSAQIGMALAPQMGVATSQLGVASLTPQMGVASVTPQVGVASGVPSNMPSLNSLEQPGVPLVQLHTAQPQSTSQTSSDSDSTGRRKSECMVQRSEVMGMMEGHFDQLMDDIRETNPHNILRRTPPTQTPPGQQSEEEEPDSSSYTGMATALANAIKERRQHISDKRRSLGEESICDQEWQSP